MKYIASEMIYGDTHYFYNNVDNMIYEYGWSGVLFKTCIFTDICVTAIFQKQPFIETKRYMYVRDNISRSCCLSNHILSIILTEL